MDPSLNPRCNSTSNFFSTTSRGIDFASMDNRMHAWIEKLAYSALTINSSIHPFFTMAARMASKLVYSAAVNFDTNRMRLFPSLTLAP